MTAEAARRVAVHRPGGARHTRHASQRAAALQAGGAVFAAASIAGMATAYQVAPAESIVAGTFVGLTWTIVQAAETVRAGVR